LLRSGSERVLRSGLRKRLRLEEVRRPARLVQEAPPWRLLREERLLCSGSQLLCSG
jgi:hypothetical protein